ncbi:MAG TPA: lysylphosphatidylglycerol synthase domain-containing protein [Polyangiaceae bacterium]|nr:lysylphosphatidylglycerol synthase domain-containing protein [Polyangiaceae bacterium]
MGGARRVVTGPPSGIPRTWRAAGRLALAFVGLGLVAYLVRGAGPARVTQVLWQARSWLPAAVALEIFQLASDFLTLRMLLGERRREVPATTWIRSSALAYAMMILVPAGRAAGEVARAALVAKHVGAPRAATASAQLQSAYVFAIAAWSAIECLVVASWRGVRSPLALLLAANALLMLTLSAGLLAVLWDARVGRWLERVRHRFALTSQQPPLEPSVRRRVPWRAAALCALSRTAQIVQYSIILRAVGGAPGVRATLVAHGIHLVGTTLGDVLPNGLGVVDGAYRTFAAEVGFGDAPARALSISFVAHLSQLIVATASLVVFVLSRHEAPRGSASAASERARTAV